MTRAKVRRRAIGQLDRKRVGIYTAQNRGPFLTPRQMRRIQHKRNHAAAPFGKAER